MFEHCSVQLASAPLACGHLVFVLGFVDSHLQVLHSIAHRFELFNVACVTRLVFQLHKTQNIVFKSPQQ